MTPEWWNPPPGRDRQRSQFRLGLLLGGLGTVLSGVLVAVIVNLLVPAIEEFFWPSPPPRPAQLEEIRHGIASSEGRTIFAKEADFHGTNVRSQVLVLTNRGGGSELWILDEEDGRLHNEFRFRPGHLPPLPGTRSGRYGMEVADISDLDEDGAKELTLLLQPKWAIAKGGGKVVLHRGAIGLLGLGAPDLQIPVLIRWNQAEGRYGLEPLIAEKPRYEVVPFRGPQARARSDFYQRPYLLIDPESGARHRAYGAQVSKVVRNGIGQPYLLNAYPARWGLQMQGPYGFSYAPDPNCGTARLPSGVVISLPCVYEFPSFYRGLRRGPDVLSLTAGRIDTAGFPLVRSCTGGATFFINTGVDAVRAAERAWKRLLLRSAC